MRIAMWSGPRNLSTAMMYSFASRDDCAVWDEPFYGAYLKETGIEHPLRQRILAEWPTKPSVIIDACLGSNPGRKPIFYQKHMTQHMLPGFDLSWTAKCENIFLIRHPARVIASYAAKRENPTAMDLGFVRQTKLYWEIAEISGKLPVVVDASVIRTDPKGILTGLCAQIGIEFQRSMLAWAPGGRKEDGPWAAHWYGAVHQSTGFAGPEAKLPTIPVHLQPLLEEALPLYQELHRFALK